MAADVGARCERRARRDYGGCESASLPLRVCARVCAPVCASQPASLRRCRCASARLCAPPPAGPSVARWAQGLAARPAFPGAACAPLRQARRAAAVRAPAPCSARVRVCEALLLAPAAGPASRLLRTDHVPETLFSASGGSFLASVPSAGASCALA